MDERIRAIIAFSLLPGMGSQRIKTLLNALPEPMQAFSMTRREWGRFSGFGEKTIEQFRAFNDWAMVDAILDHARKLGLILVPFNSVDYPQRLRQIYDAPVLLWAQGNLEALHKDGLAIVGTRAPSGYGKKMASQFAAETARHGLTIISGLALGIDTLAHEMAVQMKVPTVAVLGSGLDRVYPASNKVLAKKILDTGGVILSEFPPGTRPDAGNFPVRNRIVSGMSIGTLVVETGMEGGSRITARLALDQGREVFAIPHALDNDKGVGCNDLIKKGEAKLVQTFEDIYVEIKAMIADTEPIMVDFQVDDELPEWQNADLDQEALSICSHLEQKQRHIDELVVLTGMNSSQLLVHLLDLEFAGLVRQTSGKQFELVKE